jgi:hypothetical protein
MKKQVVVRFVNETEGALRYREINDADLPIHGDREGALVGDIYIRKMAIAGRATRTNHCHHRISALIDQCGHVLNGFAQYMPWAKGLVSQERQDCGSHSAVSSNGAMVKIDFWLFSSVRISLGSSFSSSRPYAAAGFSSPRQRRVRNAPKRRNEDLEYLFWDRISTCQTPLVALFQVPRYIPTGPSSTTSQKWHCSSPRYSQYGRP